MLINTITCFAGIKHIRMAVVGLPYSGAPAELLAAFKIDANAIVGAVNALL